MPERTAGPLPLHRKSRVTRANRRPVPPSREKQHHWEFPHGRFLMSHTSPSGEKAVPSECQRKMTSYLETWTSCTAAIHDRLRIFSDVLGHNPVTSHAFLSQHELRFWFLPRKWGLFWKRCWDRGTPAQRANIRTYPDEREEWLVLTLATQLARNFQRDAPERPA